MINTIIEHEHPWRYCLVGNIVKQHSFGENKNIVFGTKSFSAGTKVYINYAQWGDGLERVVVIGKPRHTRKLKQMIIPLGYIEKFRCQKVFSPAVLTLINCSEYTWWGNTEDAKKVASSLAESINERIIYC